MDKENESASQQDTPPAGEPKVTIIAAGDGSYDLAIKMKCYPDGAGGWICY